MNNPQPKQRIKVIRPGRGYERGKTYTIVRVDPSDNTLVAADSSGKEGSWVKWDHCVAGAGECVMQDRTFGYSLMMILQPGRRTAADS